MKAIRRIRRRDGFTLLEALGSVFLVGLAIAGALGSLCFVARGERRQSVKSELDLQARALTERMRRDLWLSSRALVLLYPSGPGPYTAVGFPVLHRAGDEAVILPDEQGRIEWNAFVVYHFWEGDTQEVRRTFFHPQTEGTEAERLQQMEDVVLDGHGRNTINGGQSSTRTLVRNLIEWRVNVIGARFDGYSEAAGRRFASFGTALLSPGAHDFTFRVVGKSSASQGYRFAADTFVVSPSGAPREAEAQLPAVRYSGATPVLDYRSDGSWSGNYLLAFPASGSGQEFTLRMDNDRWEERNFRQTGAVLEDTVVEFDTSVSPQEFVVQLTGLGPVWEAGEQTRNTNGIAPTESVFSGDSVRIVLRGSDMVDGGWIAFNGTNVWARFRAGASSDRKLFLRDAFIAEAALPHRVDYVSATRTPLTFGGQSSYAVAESAESDAVPFHIQKDKSYVVGFWVQGPGSVDMGYAHRWTPPAAYTGVPASYRVRAASESDHHQPAWSGRADTVASPEVIAIERLRAGYAPFGVYTSHVFDTQVSDPTYRDFDWNVTVPSGASVEMKIRAGDLPDLSDAEDWSALSPALAGFTPGIRGRFVQARAVLKPTPDGLQTPKLRNFTLRWSGETRLVDIGGSFETGPEFGIVELAVDGARLVQGLTVDVKIYKDVRLGSQLCERLTSAVYAEMSPRNTGR